MVFAPVLASGDPVPVRYTQATVLQAREHWGGYRTGPGGTVGLDAYAITPKPMTAAVRLLLRPRSGRPQAAIGVDP